MTAATKDPNLKQYYETRRVLERPPEKPDLLYMMNQRSFEVKRTKSILCRGIYSAESKGSMWGEAKQFLEQHQPIKHSLWRKPVHGRLHKSALGNAS